MTDYDDLDEDTKDTIARHENLAEEHMAKADEKAGHSAPEYLDSRTRMAVAHLDFARYYRETR